MSTRSTLEFLKTETGSGLILVAAAGLAIAAANSPASGAYFAFVDHQVTIQIGAFHETMSVLKWIKNGLMAIFFFVVGLEIKYEVLRGELSNPRRLALPVLAAVGGVVVPALLYSAINAGPGGHLNGWPVPTATDIAFALAALAIAGPRLPPSLRVFLLTLAIADDLAAVVLIGVLFSTHIDWRTLAGAGATLAVLAAMSQWRRAPYFFYVAAFVLLWAFTLKSGVNTSLAGVAAALTVPLEPRRPGSASALHELMTALHPYVAFLILPLFAFAAAGFSLADGPPGAAFQPLPVGIAVGLFIGKAVGVFGAAALAIGLGLARRPTGARWTDLLGVSILCGVGFTMSLFIAGLAFADPLAQAQSRLGVVAGSLASALVGMAVLAWSQSRRTDAPRP
ncbi:MAG: Na+/H+ antiporter NhaA [Phenylobacterium sp.]|uniref:Na+/H+ antiporter NhaA n=1 Tax=Phenylobacterium sp. TaxID=1871053 RepID=UPI002733207B|nr:Na+/H+ antiporter NhaA [Phenylobacterium sp.]MDP3174535.1 Na+/H+ antiporter NhaA [Phenylobacterium sp.]